MTALRSTRGKIILIILLFIVEFAIIIAANIIGGKSIEAGTSTIKHVTQTITAISVVLIVIGVAFGIYVANSISKPLPYLALITESIAKGDLRNNIPENLKTTSDIKKLTVSVNNMLTNLRDIIGTITYSSNQMSSFTQGISSITQEINNSSKETTVNIQEVAMGMNYQLEYVEQTSSLMSEVNNSVDIISKNAESAADAARKTIERADVGEKATREAVEKMNNISTTVAESAKVIQILGEESQQIGEITSAITAIANQTNLLSLNAAIEAARAGEAGKGFAVVAEEVRRLAEESATAAKEIESLIKGIQNKIMHAVESTDAEIKEVAEGKSIVERVSKEFKDIDQAIKQTSTMIEEISELTKAQLDQSRQVVEAIGNVSEIADKAAAHIEGIAIGATQQRTTVGEINNLAKELDLAATELTDVINRFQIEAKFEEKENQSKV